MQLRSGVLAITAILLSLAAFSQTKADDIVGIWLADGKEPAKIQIFRSGERFYGKIVWIKNPTDANGNPRVDAKNPDESRRHYPILGLMILSGFKFNGEEWKSGDIYDPQNGKTYSSHMHLKDHNTLKLRGFIGISLIGRTETWTRSEVMQ
jgi:uncharacterized protein (DUF2147 family)